MEQEKTSYKECSVCKDKVVISYDCPNCKSRVCMICALRNNWICPNCKQKLDLA